MKREYDRQTKIQFSGDNLCARNTNINYPITDPVIVDVEHLAVSRGNARLASVECSSSAHDEYFLVSPWPKPRTWVYENQATRVNTTRKYYRTHQFTHSLSHDNLSRSGAILVVHG